MSLDAPADNPPRAGWKTTVNLDRITWGDLRQLIQLAAFKADSDEVEFEWQDDPNEIPYPTGIVLRGDR